MKRLFLFVLIFLLCFSSRAFAAYDFAVIGNVTKNPDVNNIYLMFDSEKISYKKLYPSQVTSSALSDVNGIVSFADDSTVSNPSAVTSFASNHIVISNGYDFANYYYSSLASSYKIATAKADNYPVTYLIDWGNFRANDRVEMQRQDKRSLGIFLTATLKSTFPSVLRISEYNSTHTSSFIINSTPSNGFYVMDLKATTNSTQWIGIWHTFPAIRIVKDFPTGKYSRWMSNGSVWFDINWVYNRIGTLATQNSDIASKISIGKSLEGRDITALTIGKGSRNMIIDGAIHGNEKVGTFSSLRVAELLLEYYRSNPSWQSKLNQYKVIIVPVLNPDGFVRNTRQNANSSLSPSIYNRSGTSMAVNGTWITHGMPTSPEGIESQYCTITPADTNVKGVVFDATETKFQVGLTNKNTGSPITTSTSIKWDCRETCCNLNRQFPPVKTTTEPEVAALINLFKSYPPVIYFNLHEGGATQCPDLTYTLDAYIGPYVSSTYGNFSKYAIKEANKTYTALNHWGRFTEGGCSVNINKVRAISISGMSGVAHTYGSYAFRNTSSTILETFVWSSTWGARKSLWGLDYYPSMILSDLKYYDNDGNFLFTSNSFITSTTMSNDKLNILIDTTELKESSTFFINDLNSKGKPLEVFIDGNKKSEGDGWSYDANNKNITVNGATSSILLNWGATTYTATFSQTGISGVTWGATVGGNRYTSTSSSLTVPGLSGSVNYVYDSIVSGASGTRYNCSSGCLGTISSSSNTASANYVTQYYLTNNVNPAGSGRFSNSGWYNSGSSVSISSTANSGYDFSSWTGSGTGSYAGTSNPASITMNSPITETANFVNIEAQLKGYWKFDEASGNAAYDSSGNGNNGVFYGEAFNDGTLGNGTAGTQPTRLSGSNCKYGSCLGFEGTPSVIADVVNATDIPNTSLTIMAWIYPKQILGDERAIVSKWGQGTTPTDEWLFRLTNSATPKLQFYIFNITGGSEYVSSSDANIQLNEWAHVTAVYDRVNKQITFYKNGIPIGGGSFPYNGQTKDGSEIVRIGAQGGGTFDSFNGTIDEVRIWDRTLSQAEIQAEMISPLLTTRPIASYSFEESGNYVNDTHIWVNGTKGSALIFDGIDDYVKIKDSDSLDATSAISIAAWIYPISWSSSFPRIVSKEASTAASPYALELNSSGKSVTLCLDTGAGEKCLDSGSNTISLNQWHYVVGTWNGTHSKVYVNGQLKNTASQTGAMVATTNDLLIGNNPSKNRQFSGIIDEVKIYKYTLPSGLPAFTLPYLLGITPELLISIITFVLIVIEFIVIMIILQKLKYIEKRKR